MISEKSRHDFSSLITFPSLENKVLVKLYYAKRRSKLRRFNNTLQIYWGSSLIKMLQTDNSPGIQPKTLEKKTVLRIGNRRDSIWFETTQLLLKQGMLLNSDIKYSVLTSVMQRIG